jgi:hydroxypyruvate isomerase
MQLTPNLEMNFAKETPFLDRIAAAADLGFTGADMFGPGGKDISALAAAVARHRIEIGMVVGGSLTEGLNDPENHAAIEASAGEAARVAETLGARCVTVLSGNRLRGVPDSRQNAAIIEGLKRLIPIAETHNTMIVLEMLNSTYDHPGYYLDDTELMTGLIRAVDHPRIKGLYDMYHAGVMRGNLIEDIRSSIDTIGHMHMAGIPGRHEPDTGEQNYPLICREIDAAGYAGHISMEYSPTPGRDPLRGLAENKAWIEAGPAGNAPAGERRGRP